MSKTVNVWGHRGCRGPTNPPENSLEAFTAAIHQGANGIELDVFLTTDDRLVVFHDDTLERMTNGRGEIQSYSLAELKRLRLKDANGQLSNATIPTLQEVLDAVAKGCKGHPDPDAGRRFVVDIEVKEMKGKDIAAPVAAVIQRCLDDFGWTLSRFQVSSFDLRALKRIRLINSSIPLGALLHGGSEPWDIDESQLASRLPEVRDLEPRTVNLTLPSLTVTAVEMIRQVGAEPLAWTFGEPNPAELPTDVRKSIAGQLSENRIGTIISDYPSEMRQLLQKP